MDTNAVVHIKKGEARALKAGGAWIYDNEIDRIAGNFEHGDSVTVLDFDGYCLGYGFINTRSKITVRMLSRRKDAVIDEAFLEMRVRNAWEYRKATVDTSSCRIIFGEADFLPGIVIDKFSDVLVVESLALGIDRLKPLIVEILKRILASTREATPRCASRREWSAQRASSERSLTPRWRSWKTVSAIWWM